MTRDLLLDCVNQIADSAEHLSTGRLQTMLESLLPLMDDGADVDVDGGNAEAKLAASIRMALSGPGPYLS